MALFERVGSRWIYTAMGNVPYGLRWEAIYPLMDRLELPRLEWEELHECLMVMERSALVTLREFAPKPKH